MWNNIISFCQEITNLLQIRCQFSESITFACLCVTGPKLILKQREEIQKMVPNTEHAEHLVVFFRYHWTSVSSLLTTATVGIKRC